MRFKTYIEYYLLEGQNEDQAKAILKKNGLDKDYDKLLSITSSYRNTPQGKNNKHLRVLAAWYTKDKIDLNILNDYYSRFINNTKINVKPIDKLSFSDFEQLVDSTVTQTNKDSKTEDLGKPYFENDGVTVYYADTKEKAIKYGQGSKYGFCISRLDFGNLYHGYRKNGATFYFVYFKQPQEKAKEGFVVIHAYPNNRYNINYATENRDFDKTKKDILDEFPILTNVFDKLKYQPLSAKEEQLYNVVEKTKSITDLKTVDLQLMYIELGKEIQDDEWDKLKQKELLLKKYIEVSMHDIPDNFEKEYPKLWNRHIQKLKQRVDIKTQNRNSNFTKQEIKYVVSDFIKNKPYDPISQLVLGNSVRSFIYAKTLDFKNVSDNVLKTISTDLTQCHEYALQSNYGRLFNVPDIILKTIAKQPLDAYRYAEHLDFKNIPKIIFDGFKEDAFGGLPKYYTVAK